MSNKRMLYGISNDSNESMRERGFEIVAVFPSRERWESQDWDLNCPDDLPLRATVNESGFTVWGQEVTQGGVQYVARIKKTSEYAGQDSGKPFSVQLSYDASDAVAGYIWRGGPGGRYRSKDLDIFAVWKDKTIKVL